MIHLLLFLAPGVGVVAPAVYYTGILNPVVDTAGDFSTNEDPDPTEDIPDLSTALGPGE